MTPPQEQVASAEHAADHHDHAEASFYAARGEPLTMTWKNLDFNVKVGEETHKLLHNVSGSVVPGELLAIMGPSGAGKSTMMNVLASRAPYGKPTGSILINGQSPKKFTKKIAYVMQEDALFTTMTPRETLEFTAGLKLPDLSAEEQAQTIDSVLGLLGLTENQDRAISTIPGLKKRVAVAVELVSSPSLIFLDEPTSHLDSYSAYTLVRHLKALARAGCTIVCTIHQPSSEVFDMFDKVMLLARGRCVYNGPVRGVVAHFAEAGIHCKPNYNPADFAMNQLQLCSLEELAPLVETTAKAFLAEHGEGVEHEVAAHEEPPSHKAPSHKASFWQQTMELTHRESKLFLRDTELLVTRFGMTIVQSLLVGLYFLDAGHEWGTNGSSDDMLRAARNHWGSVQLMSMSAMFLTAQPMVLAFPNERPVFVREYATGTYHTTPYLLAKTIVEIPTAFVQNLLSFLIAYWMIDMQGNFIFLVLICTGLGLVTSSTAMMIGASASRPEDAMNLVPLVYTPQMVSSGVFLAVDGMPSWVQWVQWVCPLKYGLGLCTIAELGKKHVPEYAQDTVHYLLHASDIDEDDWWFYVIILAGMFVLFRIMTVGIMAYRASTFA